jgi:hypothetical protein
MKIQRLDKRFWYSGPRFDYRAAGKKLTVNVVGSSWPIRGLALAQAVCDVLRECHGEKVLDFGAGSWLRYVEHIRHKLPTRDVYAVEFDEAFRGDSADLKRRFQSDVTFWTPSSFKKQHDQKFDLILLINVLNTMPEEEHQRQVFKCLSERLNPLGWLVVYQRVWTEGENPAGALPYGDGWLIPQTNYNYYTYRAKTGAKWFNARAAACRLKSVTTKAEAKISSRNTLFRVWEKPLAN